MLKHWNVGQLVNYDGIDCSVIIHNKLERPINIRKYKKNGRLADC